MTRLALLVAALLLAGCQNARYEPKGKQDSFGFSSRSVSDRRFSVMFEGSPTTDLPQAKDFAMLRAAELTREAGATHFKVIADHSRVKHRVYPASRFRHVKRSHHFEQSHHPVYAPEVYPFNEHRQYPVAWFEIEIYTDALPAGHTGVLDAAETRTTLAQKYRLNLEGRIKDGRS